MVPIYAGNVVEAAVLPSPRASQALASASRWPATTPVRAQWAMASGALPAGRPSHRTAPRTPARAGCRGVG